MLCNVDDGAVTVLIDDIAILMSAESITFA